MQFNWKKRFRNKAFWVALIPAVLLLIRQVGAVFGYELDLNQLSDQLIGIVETIFMILVVLGVVVDPTTDGLGDSDYAMTHDRVEEHEEFGAMGIGEEEE